MFFPKGFKLKLNLKELAGFSCQKYSQKLSHMKKYKKFQANRKLNITHTDTYLIGKDTI